MALVPAGGDRGKEVSVPYGAIAIHTGGGLYPKTLLRKIKPYCREACVCGVEQLLQGRSCVEAVTEAVAVLENCPYLNAGVGSNLNRAGLPELDASLIDGSDASFGSVSCCKTLVNPIRGARLLLDNCKRGVDENGLVLPLMLSGPGISHFSREKGLKTCLPEQLITDGSYQSFKEETAIISGQQLWMRRPTANLSDTVGAVCVDSTGRSAAG